MSGDLFVRLLLLGSLLAVAACAASGRVEPKSTQTHPDQQMPINSGSAVGGGGGGY
jgi:hypothetical protein